jgi:hypothetical protein
MILKRPWVVSRSRTRRRSRQIASVASSIVCFFDRVDALETEQSLSQVTQGRHHVWSVSNPGLMGVFTQVVSRAWWLLFSIPNVPAYTCTARAGSVWPAGLLVMKKANSLLIATSPRSNSSRRIQTQLGGLRKVDSRGLGHPRRPAGDPAMGTFLGQMIRWGDHQGPTASRSSVSPRRPSGPPAPATPADSAATDVS